MCIEDKKAKWAAEKGRNRERGMGINFKAVCIFMLISRQTPRDVVINLHTNIYIYQGIVGAQLRFRFNIIFEIVS